VTTIIKPWRSVLDPATLLKRSAPREGGWKGCDAVLASKWPLKRQGDLRQHVVQGRVFNLGGAGGILFRCQWRGCEEPGFTSSAELAQYIEARHISRILACPYEDCYLGSPMMSHRSRHGMKTHDEPGGVPSPRANLSERLEPYQNHLPAQPFPTAARSDEMTTPRVPGSSYSSAFLFEWSSRRLQTPLSPGKIHSSISSALCTSSSRSRTSHSQCGEGGVCGGGEVAG
jgi:hypothetical protein